MTFKSRYWSVLSNPYAALTGVAALVILILSIAPPLSGLFATSGPFPHVIAYGILCILTGIWLYVDSSARNPALYAALLSSLFGLFIECVQYCVLYRSFEMSDLLINCSAAVVAIVPCRVILRYVPVNKKPTESDGLTSQSM